MDSEIVKAKKELIKVKIKSIIDGKKKGKETTEEQMLSGEEIETLAEMIKKAEYEEGIDYFFAEEDDWKFIRFSMDNYSIFFDTYRSTPLIKEEYDDKIKRIDLLKLGKDKAELTEEERAELEYTVGQFANLCEILKNEGKNPGQIAINVKLLKRFFDENGFILNRNYNFREETFEYEANELQTAQIAFKVHNRIITLIDSDEQGYSYTFMESEEDKLEKERQLIKKRYRKELADSFIKKIEKFRLIPIEVVVSKEMSEYTKSDDGDEYTIEDFITESRPFLNWEERPNLICKDGYELSIQTSFMHYSEIGNNGECLSFEVSGIEEEQEIPSLNMWKVDINPFVNIYAYVPYKKVAELIKSHGGIDVELTREEIENSPKVDHGKNDEMEAYVSANSDGTDEYKENLLRMAWAKKKREEQLKKAEQLYDEIPKEEEIRTTEEEE